MNPATIAAIISLVAEAIQEYPAISAELQSIFAKANPTPADWEALKAKILSESYEGFVPKTQIPPA